MIFGYPNKKPRRLFGLGVVNLQSVEKPARPYSLPVASVSKESDSRQRRFMFS
jgi:hypothetical protein